MSKTNIPFTAKQQTRLEQFIKELQIIEERIKQLQDVQKSFQMGVQAMLATILENENVPDDAQYQIAENAKSLVLIENKES